MKTLQIAFVDQLARSGSVRGAAFAGWEVSVGPPAVRPLIKLELAEKKTGVLPVSDETKPMIPDFKVLGHWLTFQGGVSRSC